MMRLFAATLLASAAFAGPANSVPLLFNFEASEPGFSLSFLLDSNPTPSPLVLLGVAFDGVMFSTSSGTSTGRVLFIDQLNGGGFQTHANAPFFLDAFGPQIYTGPITSPMFSPGSFVLSDFNNETSGGTLTISAVQSAIPEPASWAMMIIGFGATGLAIRRRKIVNTTVTYA